MDVVSIVDLNITMRDERSWNKIIKEIFECAKKEPVDIGKIAASLYDIAKMNYTYYQVSAEKYAEIARKLQLPPPPPPP
jgi:hypothetical protein